MSDVVKSARSLFNLPEKINKMLSAIEGIEILNQELIAKTPELLGEYSVAISRPIVSKLNFPFPSILSLDVHSLPSYSDQRQAVYRSKDGFEISAERIRPVSDTLLLQFTYRIKDDKFTKKLVQKNVQRDTPRGLEDEVDEYWMHAQLTDPKIFKRKGYGRLDLRDIDFGVSVAVHQDLKTAIPSDFARNLKIISEWIKTKDRVKKWRLGREHLHLRPKSYTGREDELISDVQKLFFPHEFKRFVDVTAPFHYYESLRGVDFYDLPFQAFPKTMTVVSRTTLNSESPAAKGKLIYKKQVLRDEISQILGIFKKKKRKRKRRAIAVVKVTQREEVDPNDVVSKIEEKLRPTIHKRPEKEREIQDNLENLFLTLDYDFEREQVSFAYSTKSYKPDFTSDSLKTAVDVKLCKDPLDEKRIIDEINADIPAYKTHYENLIFVVYDLGCIRKVDSFAKGIEKAHKKVFVRVIKH